ncbi:MAG: hypothetical protein JWQ01_298 [Massilia sp.]|nr:hypothetical protein [Massilia sp.]
MTRGNGYDQAGQLTAINYTNADGGVLGDLAIRLVDAAGAKVVEYNYDPCRPAHADGR